MRRARRKGRCGRGLPPWLHRFRPPRRDARSQPEASPLAVRPCRNRGTLFAMLQVIQPINGQATEAVDPPAPACGPNHVLIANLRSLVSAGTERSLVALARKSL